MEDTLFDKKVSIITVTYNSANALVEHWKDFTPTKNIEWIVVDNNSSDSSADVAERLGARVLKLPDNVGFSTANNIGFKSSVGEFVIFVNPDVVVKVDDIPALYNASFRYNSLVAPQLINPDGSLQPNGRGIPFLYSKILNRLAPTSISNIYHRYTTETSIVECEWITGAVVCGTRSHLSRLGPWDEEYFVYYEDSDLGLRNLANGSRNIVVGSARWIHSWARETSQFNYRAWKLEIRSGLKFYRRYPNYLNLFSFLRVLYKYNHRKRVED